MGTVEIKMQITWPVMKARDIREDNGLVDISQRVML
jgi:hypothetical protein